MGQSAWPSAAGASGVSSPMTVTGSPPLHWTRAARRWATQIGEAGRTTRARILAQQTARQRSMRTDRQTNEQAGEDEARRGEAGRDETMRDMHAGSGGGPRRLTVLMNNHNNHSHEHHHDKRTNQIRKPAFHAHTHWKRRAQ